MLSNLKILIVHLVLACIAVNETNAQSNEILSDEEKADNKQRHETEVRVKQLIKEMVEYNLVSLHSDYTPATRKLIKIGRPAVGPCLELFLSEKRRTRIRALRVIDGVGLVEFGFKFGQGWANEKSESDYLKFLDSMPDLNYDDSLEDRKKAVKRWAEFYSKKIER